jgi:hypothetical protein
VASTVVAKADIAISRNIFSCGRDAILTGYSQFADTTAHKVLEKELLKGQVSGLI